MKAILTTITVLSAMVCLPLFALQCAWCNQSMLDGDQCCHNCGKEKGSKPQVLQQQVPTSKLTPVARDYGSYQRYNHENDTFSGFGGHLLGMGRGLATTSLSPLNIVRGMGTGCAWIGSVDLSNAGEGVFYCSVFFISAGALMGTFATCADVINGILDTASVGYYGNWLYDSQETGRPTPWIWERKWSDKGIPWIDKK